MLYRARQKPLRGEPMSQAQLFQIWLAMQTAKGTQHEVKDANGESWGVCTVLQCEHDTDQLHSNYLVRFADGSTLNIGAGRIW